MSYPADFAGLDGTGRSMRRLTLFLLILGLLIGLIRSVCGGQDRPSVRRAIGIASGLRAHGEYALAEAAIREAMVSLSRYRNPSDDGRCLLRLGLLRWDLGAIDESKRFFEQARSAFEQAFDRRSAEYCSKCLDLNRTYQEGKEARLAKLYFRSLDRFDEAFRLGRELGFEDFGLKTLRQQALTYLEMRRLDLFFDNSQRGLALAKRLNHRIEQARCANNIGVYYQQRSSFPQAVDHFEEAFAALKQDTDPATEAECLNNLGLVYRELGNLGQARHYLAGALAIDRTAGDPIAICVDLVNLGSVEMRQGIENESREDLLLARRYIRDGLDALAGHAADPRIYFAALNNLGVIYNELREREEARRHFRRALAVVSDGWHSLEQCQCLNNLALSFLDDRNADEARALYLRSLEISSRDPYDNILMDAHLGLGRCAQQRNDLSAALAHFRLSMEALERLRGRIPTEPFSIGYARNRFAVYEQAAHLIAATAFRTGSERDLAELLELIERSKARAFLENVHDGLAGRPASDEASRSERAKALSRNIQELSLELSEATPSPDRRAALKAELELEEDEFVRLMSGLKTASADPEERWRGRVRSLREIQGMLSQDDAVLLEYYLGSPRSYLLRIAPAGIKLYNLPAKNRIEASLRGFLKFIADRSIPADEGMGPAERIGRELLPFEEDDIALRAKALLVVPDGVLHHLPFEALRIPDGAGFRYLIERQPVSYCPSASALMILKQAPGPAWGQKDLLAVGAPQNDPGDRIGGSPSRRGLPYSDSRAGMRGHGFPSLPFSRKEVLDIAGLFPPANVVVLTGQSADEGRIKGLALTDYKIIHFATHGLLDERYPYRSALILSPPRGGEEDGRLQTREIFGLTMDAGLIVLSACQTARGRLEDSEGPMALARPFFFAGARSVVASLWQINDRATVRFMGEFYRSLALGRTKAASLRAAKLRMLGSAWAHPFYWAAFLLQGDPSALDKAAGCPGRAY